VTITGDHTTDERALLAQLSGFLDSAEPSKVVHLSETAKTVHFAHVAKIKFIDGIAQLIDPSADELSLAETLGIATANLDPSNNQGPDFVPGCSGATAAVDRPVAGPREQALLTRPIIGVATTYARPWATSAGWRPAMAAKAAGQRTATVKTVVTKVNRTWYEARAMSPSEIR
jgi:hypothetical protein